MSWPRIAFSIACHAFYSQMLNTFPNIQLDDPFFIISCVLAVADHFLWFFWFAEANHFHRFMDISAFFGLMIWLVPFMFFISLSAAENTLPAFDANSANSRGSSSASGGFGKKTNLVKGVINLFLKKQELLPSLSPNVSRKEYKQY
ncbi:DUF396-domain-containing protein [Rhizoclosmatium globosum]|uniref:DUF396-domain-containing protein n=1 Tax=Rhizoclosmatium globosum TaxID=329046 RepID=A0A1Y2BKQ5_9FUNG|nr:DUF396-domain-containing protein [Rhizoclosmatium globosum]|eukprot:ORY35187.1 DUF396-domain-containing protein [Rhizoclosmatium globosum]